MFHFVRYMEQLQSYKEDFGEAGILGENENAVRIMTIHKSKGLEFPVVIVAGLGKSFNRQDIRSRVVIHPELGVGVDWVDAAMRTRTASLPKRVLQKALDLEMLGEELRVLYVAFTRAKEKLILLGSAAKLEEKMQKNPVLSGYFPRRHLSGLGTSGGSGSGGQSFCDRTGDMGGADRGDINPADFAGRAAGGFCSARRTSGSG